MGVKGDRQFNAQGTMYIYIWYTQINEMHIPA